MSHFSVAERDQASPRVRLVGLTGARPEALSAWDLFAERLLTVVNAVAFLGGLLIIAEVDSPLRPWFAALLVLAGPGSGIVQLIGRFETASRWVLAIGLSLACSVLTAEVLLHVHRLNLEPAAVTLTSITGLGIVASIRNLAARKL